MQTVLSNKQAGSGRVIFNTSFNPNSKFNKENYQYIDGNLIHRTAIINWERVRLGRGNTIGPYACVGTEPPNVSEVSDGFVEIGNSNNICEYVTIHLPTKGSIGTVIGNNNLLMSSAHIGHDCVLEDNIILCNNSAVGACRIMGRNIGFKCIGHQFKVVGSKMVIILV